LRTIIIGLSAVNKLTPRLDRIQCHRTIHAATAARIVVSATRKAPELTGCAFSICRKILKMPRSDLFCQHDETNRAAHFVGGRLESRIADLGDIYSVSLWFWNGMPADARETAFFPSSRLSSVMNFEHFPADRLRAVPLLAERSDHPRLHHLLWLRRRPPRRRRRGPSSTPPSAVYARRPTTGMTYPLRADRKPHHNPAHATPLPTASHIRTPHP
jgi:hypothetical protein